MPRGRLTEADANRKGFIERLNQIAPKGQARAFAKLAGIPPTTFAKCLKGITDPTRPTLIAIAKAADVRLDWLLLGEGAMKRGDDPLPSESPRLAVYEGGRAEGPIDFELLADCLEVLDEVLNERRRTMSHAKKAQAAALLYRIYKEEKGIDRKAALRLVDLASS